MDSTSTKPSTGRRFSFQSLRSNSSSQDLHASTSNSQPDAGLFAHRTLLHTARGSKPPTSGPAKSRAVSNAAPSSSSSSSNHQHQRSMPSELSSLFGTVKRSLSFDRSRKPKPDASSSIPTYVGTTAEEDAARLYGLGPQRPLLPSPTFEQIASGMAVRSKRSSPRLPSTEPPQHVHHHHHAPPPRRSSMKKPSFSTTNSSSTDFSNSVSSASSPYITPPLPTNSRQLKHVTSTLASASSSSTCTSSSTSFSTGAVPVALPFPPQQERKSHKLSLSLSTITGRRAGRGNNNGSNNGGAMAGLGLPMSNGKNNSSTISSVDSSLSWGAGGGGGAVDVSSKKAVRFSESEDGHANASAAAFPSVNSTPAVVVLDPRRVPSSLTTTMTSTSTTTKRQAKGEPRPQLVNLNSSSFTDRTPKFLRR